MVDTGPQSSEQAYFDKAQKALDRGQYLDATKSLEAIDTYYPTDNTHNKHNLNFSIQNLSKRL